MRKFQACRSKISCPFQPKKQYQWPQKFWKKDSAQCVVYHLHCPKCVDFSYLSSDSKWFPWRSACDPGEDCDRRDSPGTQAQLHKPWRDGGHEKLLQASQGWTGTQRENVREMGATTLYVPKPHSNVVIPHYELENSCGWWWDPTTCEGVCLMPFFFSGKTEAKHLISMKLKNILFNCTLHYACYHYKALRCKNNFKLMCFAIAIVEIG